MKMMIYFAIALVFYTKISEGLMTNAQIQATQRLVRRSCKAQMKITNDDELDGMLKGNWENLSRSTTCYLNCCLKMIKMVKNDGHLDFESGMKQAQNLPDPRRELTENTLKTCKDAGISLTDKCEIAYEICKCTYLDNPKNYIIP